MFLWFPWELPHGNHWILKITLLSVLFLFLHRCALGDVVTHTAWLNRSSILYAGEDKWSIDPRVSLVTLNQEEFTIKIENVDMTDEGQYVCAIQTSSRPRTTSVHILIQGNDAKIKTATAADMILNSTMSPMWNSSKLLFFPNVLQAMSLW